MNYRDLDAIGNKHRAGSDASDHAAECDDATRAFVLNALAKFGIDVPNDAVLDKRKTNWDHRAICREYDKEKEETEIT
jgi:hypothetical protein